MEHYENLGLPPVATHFHQPAEVFPDKGKLFSNIKGERQMFWVFDCIVLLDKDTGIMPKKQMVDVKCVTIYL